MIKFNKTTQKIEIKIIDFGAFVKIGSKIVSVKGTKGFINNLVQINFHKNIKYTVTYDIFSLGQTFEILYSNIIGQIQSINNNIIIEPIDYKIYKLFYRMISPHRPGFNNVLDNYLQKDCNALKNRYINLSQIQKCQNPLIEKRYSSMEEVIKKLEAIIEDISSL